MPDWIDDLNAAVDEHGQSEVARRLGCSPATVSQLKKRRYQAGTLAKWRARFEASFGSGMVACPVLGAIGRDTCSFHRARPFAATNPVRIRLYKACQTCPNNPDRDAS